MKSGRLRQQSGEHARPCRQGQEEGVRILSGVEVKSFEFGSNSGAVTALNTNQGRIACDTVVVGVGPWVNKIWNLLELPKKITVKANGKVRDDVPMWKFWCLEEGTLGVDPHMHRTNDGRFRRCSMSIPTRRSIPTATASSSPTRSGASTTSPISISAAFRAALALQGRAGSRSVAVDPYGPESPEFVVGEDFIEMWCSALAHCQKRFEGQMPLYKRDENSAGSAASRRTISRSSTVPRERLCHRRSNHGYKMIGVGKLVAQELVGETSRLLEPFRFARFAKGELHPTSHSPFPWS